MVEYSKVNVKLTDTQVKKLKTAVKNKSGATLRMSLNMFDGNDLPHELLLTTRQKTNLRNAFNNNMSTNLKLSKAQISKTIQSGGFLGPLLSKLAGPLAKNILAPLGVTAAASAIDARSSKENTRFRDNNFNNFKWRNEWHYGNRLSSWRSNILLKGVTKTIKNEAKEQKGGFLSMLLGTLGASLLGNILAGKGIVGAGSGNKKGKGIVRAGYGK